jgi:hypothetical protein
MNKALYTNPQSVQPVFLTKASQFCLEKINHFKSKGLIVHNFSLAQNLSNHIYQLGILNQFEEHDILAPQIAAFMLVLGYQDSYNAPWEMAIPYVKDFCSLNDIDEELKDKITYTIFSLNKQGDPISMEARLFSDALTSLKWIEQISDFSKMSRTERQLKSSEYFEDLDWEEIILRELLDLRFYLEGSNKIYQERLSHTISEQNEKIQKLQRKTLKLSDDKAFVQIEKRIPTSGIQTFFRTNYRNHINLSAIADNKANIMISVNAVLITVIISILSYKNLTEIEPGVFFPAVIFLCFGLASLTMAVLASRPKVTNHINKDLVKEGRSKNLIFFGNFVKLTEEEYEEAMDNMFKDTNLLYSNLSADIYNLGKVLEKKYKLLAASYNFFLIGFGITVLFFIILLGFGMLGL